jgi:hypothetical protein
MGRLTVHSPVTPTLALAFAGGAPFRRKVLLAQTRHEKVESLALMAGETPLALVMLFYHRRRRAELAIAFQPGAGAHMRKLIRFAQLTLRALAQTGVLVFTRIQPLWSQGRRMAQLTGLQPGGFRDGAIWLWKG